MTQNKNRNILYTQDARNLYSYAMSKFLPTKGFKWINHNDFDLNKILAIVQKDVFSKSILNILKSYQSYIIIIL